MRIIIFLILLLPFSLLSQTGGVNSFTFVNIETSPRIESIGGNAISIYDGDLLLSQTTPSLLNQNMHNKIAFAFCDYFSDINLLSFAYAREIKEIGVFSIAIKSINYGSFDLNDPVGNTNGSFSASDQVFTLGIGKTLHDRLSIGMNLSILNSQYETYHSLALSSNLSTTYHNSSKNFTSTLLIKNIGRQIKSYSQDIEKIPFEIQLGVSKKLAHLPFRYHLSYNNLNQFFIESPYKLITQTNLETGELEVKEETIAKTFLRHIVIGGELNPFRRNLFLRAGYSFQRRFDMTIRSYPALVGFSWGVGFSFSNFQLDYSRSSYHLSGVTNNFSIATNLSTFGI